MHHLALDICACKLTQKEVAAQRWQLSCHLFWCKLTLTSLLKQPEAKIYAAILLDISTCYCCSYSSDQHNRTEHSFKAEERLQKAGTWQFSCHQT